MNARHFINGIEITPVNYESIEFVFDWTQSINEAQVNVDSIQLVGLGKKLVLEHIANFGIMEGIPYRIEVGMLSLDYYIDLTENPVISDYGDDPIEVSIFRRREVDWFMQQANGLSFDLINSKSIISTSDIKYLIVKDNQGEMLIMLSITIYSLSQAIADGVKALTDTITQIIDASVPNAGVPPSYDTGGIISLVLLAVAQTIYLAALTIALINLTKQVMDIVFPPIQKFKGATLLELFNKGCQHLGLTFESQSIEDLQYLTICGVPLQPQSSSIFTTLFSAFQVAKNKGYPTSRDTVSTLGRLIDAEKKRSNSELRILNGVVRLETKNYWESQSGINVLSTLNVQETRSNEWRYNTGDIWKRYYLKYQYDVSDSHTMDSIDQTDVEYSTEPISVVNPDLVSIKGLAEIGLPFALGIRKDKLTVVEEFAKGLAELGDSVISFFGGNANLVSKIKGRIGVMQISQQYFSVTKLLYLQGNKQPVNYLEKMSAYNLAEKYHKTNFVKENFKKIFTSRIPFSNNNADMLMNNNYLIDQNGVEIQLISLNWLSESNEATIEYAVKSNEGDNTKTILING